MPKTGLEKSLDEFNAMPLAPYGILKISDRRFMVVCQSGRSRLRYDPYCTPTFQPQSGQLLPYVQASEEATLRNNSWWEQNHGTKKAKAE